jgi:hypothetical protein
MGISGREGSLSHSGETDSFLNLSLRRLASTGRFRREADEKPWSHHHRDQETKPMFTPSSPWNSRAASRRRRPQVEALEGRLLLSGQHETRSVPGRAIAAIQGDPIGVDKIEPDVPVPVFRSSVATLPWNPSATTSDNWSGYVAQANSSRPQPDSVSAVSGSWVVPEVTGPSTGATYGSVWVGIDGYSNATVEQVGTEADFVNGKPVYYAWWEMYSSGGQQPEQPITSMTVQPGDLISASVQHITSGAHAGQFDLSIVDRSQANDSFGTYQASPATQSPLAQRSSAEWIVEAPTVHGFAPTCMTCSPSSLPEQIGDAPTNDGGIATLPNFGSVAFSHATAVINGVSGAINSPSWNSQAVDIVSGGVTSDTTSVLTDSGTSFVVTDNTSAGAAMTAGPKAEAGVPTGTVRFPSNDPTDMAPRDVSNRVSPTSVPEVSTDRSPSATRPTRRLETSGTAVPPLRRPPPWRRQILTSRDAASVMASSSEA